MIEVAECSGFYHPLPVESNDIHSVQYILIDVLSLLAQGKLSDFIMCRQ